MLRRILIVEDSPKDVELMLEALEESHLANEVDLARNGEEALDYLFRRGSFAGRTGELPAVIWLDLKMPKIDGLDVLKEIRQDPRLKHIPVVMLTSSREESDLVRSYELGVNAYVVKPVGFKEFIEGIKQLGLFWGVLNEVPRQMREG